MHKKHLFLIATSDSCNCNVYVNMHSWNHYIYRVSKKPMINRHSYRESEDERAENRCKQDKRVCWSWVSLYKDNRDQYWQFFYTLKINSAYKNDGSNFSILPITGKVKKYIQLNVHVIGDYIHSNHIYIEVIMETSNIYICLIIASGNKNWKILDILCNMKIIQLFHRRMYGTILKGMLTKRVCGLRVSNITEVLWVDFQHPNKPCASRDSQRYYFPDIFESALISCIVIIGSTYKANKNELLGSQGKRGICCRYT